MQKNNLFLNISASGNVHNKWQIKNNVTSPYLKSISLNPEGKKSFGKKNRHKNAFKLKCNNNNNNAKSIDKNRPQWDDDFVGLGVSSFTGVKSSLPHIALTPQRKLAFMEKTQFPHCLHKGDVQLPVQSRLYGVNFHDNKQQVRQANKSPVKTGFRRSTLFFQPLHAIGLQNPCHGRNCSHPFKSFIKVTINEVEHSLKKETTREGTMPCWSKSSALTIDLEFSQPTCFELRVYSECCQKHILIGKASIPLSDLFKSLRAGSIEECQFYSLLKKRKSRTICSGKIKLLLHLKTIAKQFMNEVTGKTFQLRKSCVENRNINSVKAVEDIGTCTTKSEQLLNLLNLEIQKNGHDFAIDNVVVKHNLGEGIFATVKYAYFIDEVEREVAIKEYRYNTIPNSKLPPYSVLTNFQKEYETLKAVAHQNLVLLLGVTLAPTIGLVTEYMNQGSLKQFMESSFWDELTFKQKIEIMLDVSNGLKELHRAKYIHRDVKLHNILISVDSDSSIQAKVGDLGSAYCITESNLCFEMAGTVGYTAPEIIEGLGYDEKVDIWSFSILLWEVLSYPQSLSNPFVLAREDELIKFASSSMRPQIPDECPTQCSNLLQKCWAYKKEDRPSMSEIHDQLQLILEEI